MSSARFAGQQIESWNPSQDVRSIEAGRLFVLKGRNYLFDSKGPKSGFGHRCVSGGLIGNETDVQSVQVGQQFYVMTSDGIFSQKFAQQVELDALDPSNRWHQYFTFDADRLNKFASFRWTGAYLNGSTYLGNQNKGLFRVGKGKAVLHTADGVPSDPIAIGVVSSRLLVISKKIIAWSGPGDGNDFVPDIGGAGFQLLSLHMAGKPLGVTFFEQGCVVWSATSALLCEYIGGDAVFRFDTLKSELYPIGPMAITADPNGRAFMMTRFGIVIVSGQQIDATKAPGFNEYIRKYLEDNQDVRIRLEYILESDLLFIQLSDSLKCYTTTFVLSVTIDKWGSFDENHLGICRFGDIAGSTGFADLDGRMHKFDDTPDREYVGQGLVGLDAEITIGYFNDPQMVIEADTILEMQELMISARESFPDDADLEIHDWQGKNKYDWWGVVDGITTVEDFNIFNGYVPFNEDMNTPLDDAELELIDDEDNDVGEDEIIDDDLNDEGEEYLMLNEDFNVPGYSIDWNLGPQPDIEDFNTRNRQDESEDWNFADMQGPVPVSDIERVDDWNLVWDDDEDYGGPYSFYNFTGYKILFQSSMNGFEFENVIDPQLALGKFNRDLWVEFTAGRFQSINLTATERWEKFHVTSLDASIIYKGQYS